MKSFLVGCAVAVILAIGSAAILDRFQEPASMAYATTGVRL